MLCAGSGSACAEKPPRPRAGSAPKVTGPTDEPVKGLSEFLIEGANGVGAAEVDAFLESVIGSRTTKALRSNEWATRVNGLESFAILLQPEAPVSSGERSALFKAGVAIVARLIQDKVVPVFLPALATVKALYSPPTLGAQLGKLPALAVPIFTPHIVIRASSSNLRAREEAAATLRHLARAVDPTAVCPSALRPLTHSKSAQGLVGRLQLLHALIEEYGVGSRSGLASSDVLGFVAPLVENAAQQVREAALAVVTLMRPGLTDEALKRNHPALAAKLFLTAKPAVEPLGISGRRLPPLQLAPIEGGAEVKLVPPLARRRTPWALCWA